MGLLSRQVRGRGCLPFPSPRAAGGAGQDAGTHPKVWKALTRRKVHQRGPLVEDISSRQLLLLLEVKRGRNRFLKFDLHAGPPTEVRHHLQEMAHSSSRLCA